VQVKLVKLCYVDYVRVTTDINGGAENDGHENDGPSKLQGMKMQDRKLQDMTNISFFLFLPIPVILAVLWKI